MENVIPLFSKRNTGRHPVVEADGLTSQEATGNQDSKELKADDFATIAKRNAEIQEKLRLERAKANANVLKSYRIK